ncbi:MAG TPA: hypothetical protein VIM63_15395 [Rhodoferax sp.]
MTTSTLTERFALLHPTEQALIAILALMGPISSRSRMMDYLAKADLKSPKGKGYNGKSMDALLAELVQQGLVEHPKAEDFRCASGLIETAINQAVSSGALDALCTGIEIVEKCSEYAGHISLGSYLQGIRLLRLALIRGRDRSTTQRYLIACANFPDFRKQHPYIEICGTSFHPRFMALLHPEMQEVVTAALLQDAMLDLHKSHPVVAYAESVFKSKTPGAHAAFFIAIYAEHALLSGQFEQAEAILANRSEGQCLALHAAIALLRGNLEPAIDGFEVALKAFRATSAKRTSVFGGLMGFLHVLALMRSPHEKHKKKALRLCQQINPSS